MVGEERQGHLVWLMSGLLLGLKVLAPVGFKGRMPLQGKWGRASIGQLWSHAGCLMRLQCPGCQGTFLMCAVVCQPVD